MHSMVTVASGWTTDHKLLVDDRRPHGERWPAAWRNHNPYSDRILTSTSRQIKKSRVSHSDSDFFHLNLSLEISRILLEYDQGVLW